QLLLEILQVEAFALLDLRSQLLRFFLIYFLFYILDQRQHVAHAEDAGGNAIGMEGFETIDLLTDAEELDRLAGDMTHRQRSTAARVAVGLGEDHTGERQRFAEGARSVGRILTGHG